jgi:hypothetical protein
VNVTVDVRQDVCAAAAPDTRRFWFDPPTDPDDDGECEDVDGDGEATFDDAIEFAFTDYGGIDYPPAFDFDGDDDVDFADAVALAFADLSPLDEGA